MLEDLETINEWLKGEYGISYTELNKEIERLNKEKELLQCDLDNANSKLRDSMAIRLKAIEYLTKCNNSDLKFTSRTYDILFNILKGSDK